MLTDFHTHILPGMDDGSGSVEESLAMLRMEAAQGIRRVVATPHFYASQDDPERFLARREAALARLSRAMEAEPELPQILPGAEVRYFPGMSESAALARLTIAGKPCILIEMPPAPWTEPMYRELEGIREKQGLIPVLAHLERYVSPLWSGRTLKRLGALPVLVQVNAGAFLRRSTASFALRLLKEGRIHVLGSDCHNMEDRCPNMDGAIRVIRQRLGEDAVRRIRLWEDEILSVR